MRAAAERLRGKIHRTPTQHSRTFSALCGCEVYLKLENLQRTGAYKIRGALNRILTLEPDQQRRGVVAASSGNHAQGVALAAATVGVPATIVMPTSAPMAKVAATQGYGAQVILHGQYFDEAHAYALELARGRGLTYVHPFEDWMVMAGQGTIALEVLEDVPDLDVLLVPIGGGGLIAGMSTAARALRPTLRIVGVQAEGSDACYRAFHGTFEGPLVGVTSIADGVVVKQSGQWTMEVIRRCVDEIVVVAEDSICEAMVLLMEREKTVAEGAGALALAALLSRRVTARGARVGVLVSGGNIDLTVMDRVIQYGLTSAGRYLVLTTALEDRPGQLLRLTQLLAEQNVNIVEVVHRRRGVRLPISQVELELTLEARDQAHGRQVIQALRAAGYSVQEHLRAEGRRQ
ncbi:MAG: threonine ammonia-lyase [Chloroflexi bacterium]|nr:threonine ammonia-lyase [Chloroflexota bacterium]